MSDIEVLEQIIEISNVECKDQLQEFLVNQFTKVSKMEWEQVHIVLNYAVYSIESNRLEFSFIKEVVKFRGLMNHKNWEIREGCATSLRQLRGNENPEINKWAEKMTFQMIENENKRHLKDRWVLNILMLAPIEAIEVSNIGVHEVISNIQENETVIGRESEIAVIAFTLNDINMLMLVGKGGIGKTSIAIEYSQRYKNLYSIMHQINCETDESMKNGMVELARALGLQNNIQELLFDGLRRKLNAYQYLMLIILDKVGSHSEIHNIYVTNKNVKFLATSRSDQSKKKMLIGPLSREDSKRILQENISSPEKIEEFDKLAEVLEGWPLALVQSAKIISMQNCSIREFIKTFKNTLPMDSKIKEALTFGFSNKSSPTQYILKVLSTCGSEKIPKSMIKAVFLGKKYSDDEWVASKISLLDSDIISPEGRYWKINKIIHKYIKENYPLKPKDYEILIDYYCENFSITNGIWLHRKRINKIRHLSSHVEKLLHRQGIKNSKQFMLLFNLIYFYIKIEINPSLAANYLHQVESFLIPQNFESKDLAEIFKRLGMLYASNSKIDKSELCYLEALEILKSISPEDNQDIADIYSGLGFLKCLQKKVNESEDYYFKALGILSSTDCSDEISKTANIYVGLGNLKRDNEEYREGESFYLNALELMNKILKPGHPEFADLYANLGKLYMHEDNFELADMYYKQA